MADQILAGSGHMHFSGSGAGSIRFGRRDDRLPRVVTQLYLTTATDGTTISFDSGNNFMALAAGTHTFPYPHTHEIYFGGTGDWSGVGISV